MINCSLILKKDTYCPHMQETPLLLSHTDTAFVSLRGFMFCFLFMLLSSASFLFFFSCTFPHTCLSSFCFLCLEFYVFKVFSSQKTIAHLSRLNSFANSSPHLKDTIHCSVFCVLAACFCHS